MSILIKGMEMPTNCDMCWALDEYGDYPKCRITEEQRGYTFPIKEKRMDKCPLVPVPSHGRLIDANALLRHCVDLPRGGGYMPVVYKSYITNAPTIIEAEDEK